MSDNSLMTGADTVRDKDRSGVKTQIVGLDLGIGTGTENLMTGTMPTADAAVAARLAGATPHADAAGTGDVALTAVAGRLMSFSAAETTGSASAKFYLRDGTSSAGTIVAIVTLAAGESIRDSFGPNGIALATGLYLDRVSGSTEVTAAVT